MIILRYLVTALVPIMGIIIIVIAIIGIKKLFAYLDAKTEYYKNHKD